MDDTDDLLDDFLADEEGLVSVAIAEDFLVDDLSWRGMWGHACSLDTVPALEHADRLLLNDYVWGRCPAAEAAAMLIANAPDLPWKSLVAATRSVVVADIRHTLAGMAHRYTAEDIEIVRAYRKLGSRLWDDPAAKPIIVAYNMLEERRGRTCPRPSELDRDRASYALYFALAEHADTNLPTLEVWKLLDGAPALGDRALAESLLGDFRPTTTWGEEHESAAGLAARRRISIVEQQEDVFVQALHPRVKFEVAVQLRPHVVAIAYQMLHGWEHRWPPYQAESLSAYR